MAAPFQAGDFIEFAGFRQDDEVIAFSIVAQNVQINTLGDLVYFRMDLARMGISNPSTAVELGESRVRKYQSSPIDGPGLFSYF